ncbi:hypothetical protein L218DRAFT_1009710 [Marasmius fiardii PR-910]|nr:hypothetical protein L218DRAFT_1009710 [Marasmius fiardii PR-910]
MSSIENQVQSVKDAVSNADADGLHDAISNLLENPDFCPDGGLLAFPLLVSYSMYPDTLDDLEEVLDWLENEDHVAGSVCYTYGLDVSIKIVLDEDVEGNFRHLTWGGSRLLVDSVPHIDGNSIGDCYFTEHFLQIEADRQIIHPYDSSPCYGNGNGEPSKAVAWIGSLEDCQARSKIAWLGPDGRPIGFPVYLHLIAAFGPVGDRTNWQAYEGETWQSD